MLRTSETKRTEIVLFTPDVLFDIVWTDVLNETVPLKWQFSKENDCKSLNAMQSSEMRIASGMCTFFPVTIFWYTTVKNKCKKAPKCSEWPKKCLRLAFHSNNLLRKITSWIWGQLQPKCFYINRINDSKIAHKLALSVVCFAHEQTEFSRRVAIARQVCVRWIWPSNHVHTFSSFD